jgi:uncharacterized short protein YbdD (DUF466 family)
MSEDLIKQFTIWQYEKTTVNRTVWVDAKDEQVAHTKSKKPDSTGRTRHRVVMQVSSLWKLTEPDE